MLWNLLAKRRSRKPNIRQSYRPSLEVLEDRRLLSQVLYNGAILRETFDDAANMSGGFFTPMTDYGALSSTYSPSTGRIYQLALNSAGNPLVVFNHSNPGFLNQYPAPQGTTIPLPGEQAGDLEMGPVSDTITITPYIPPGATGTGVAMVSIDVSRSHPASAQVTFIGQNGQQEVLQPFSLPSNLAPSVVTTSTPGPTPPCGSPFCMAMFDAPPPLPGWDTLFATENDITGTNANGNVTLGPISKIIVQPPGYLSTQIDNIRALISGIQLPFAPTASIIGPSDGVPGQLRTFTVAATSPSPTVAAAGFTYSINWGDGSPMQTVPTMAGNGAGVLVQHAFTQLGSYTVTVTATDTNGLVSPVASTQVTIQQFELQTDLSNQSQTDLVFGTLPGTNNFLRFQGDPNGLVKAFNSPVVGTYTLVGTFSPTGQILVYANGANDNVEVAGTIKLPSQLFGGPGNDILIGGGGPNVIVGGSATTNMMGQGHADLLIGGRGRSTVTSQGANDLIIAGYTIFDTNPVALASILAEWASSQSYATRVGDLRGNNVVGLDLNGHNFLQANVTVFDNGQANTITPGTGLDLIFADVIPGNNDVLATIIGPLPQSDLVIDL